MKTVLVSSFDEAAFLSLALNWLHEAPQAPSNRPGSLYVRFTTSLKNEPSAIYTH
ncbi:hypothetical protein [Fibrisoma limi]|uniref:hypothetical protein n=1 Tax=Fibrisoma limi TaxID=663275 RepID=UPI001788CD4C|nr:hypothetical protein [Fibrisoma limi]